METMEESLQYAQRKYEDHSANIDRNLGRAFAFANISEKEEAAKHYALVESESREEYRYRNYIKALTYYIEQQS